MLYNSGEEGAEMVVIAWLIVATVATTAAIGLMMLFYYIGRRSGAWRPLWNALGHLLGVVVGAMFLVCFLSVVGWAFGVVLG